MNNVYSLQSGGHTRHFSKPSLLLAAVEALVEAGKRFIITFVQASTEVLSAIGDILRRHGIEVQVVENQLPTRADYVVHAITGGAIGGLAGAGLGAVGWFAAKQLAKRGILAVVPGLGPVVLVSTIVGVVTGVVAGLAVTHWGLKLRMVPAQGQDGEAIQMKFAPKGA